MRVSLILFLACFQIIETIEPLTMSAIVGGASLLTGGAVYQFWDDTIKCPLTECCSSPHWLPKNVTKFEEYFDNYVFGQHIVKNVVSKALRSHLKKTKSKKIVTKPCLFLMKLTRCQKDWLMLLNL